MEQENTSIKAIDNTTKNKNNIKGANKNEKHKSYKKLLII